MRRTAGGTHSSFLLAAAHSRQSGRTALPALSALAFTHAAHARGVRIGARHGRKSGKHGESEKDGSGIQWADIPPLQPAHPSHTANDVQDIFASRPAVNSDATVLDDDVGSGSGSAGAQFAMPRSLLDTDERRDQQNVSGRQQAADREVAAADEGERLDRARRRVMRRLAASGLDGSDMHPDFRSLDEEDASPYGAHGEHEDGPPPLRGRGRRSKAAVQDGDGQPEDPMAHPDPDIRAAFRAFAAKYGGAGQGGGQGGREGETPGTSAAAGRRRRRAGPRDVSGLEEEGEEGMMDALAAGLGDGRPARGRVRGRGQEGEGHEQEGDGSGSYTLPSVVDVTGRAVVPPSSDDGGMGSSNDDEEEEEGSEEEEGQGPRSARAERLRARQARSAAHRAAWDASIGGPSPRVLAWDKGDGMGSSSSEDEDEGDSEDEDSLGMGTGSSSEEEGEGEYGSGSEEEEEGAGGEGGDMEAGEEELEAFLARRQAVLERRVKRGRRAWREAAGFSGPRGEPGLPAPSSPVPLLAPTIVPAPAVPGGLRSLPRTISSRTHGELLPYSASIPEVRLDGDILTRIDLLCAGMSSEEVASVRRATLERRVREVEDEVRARALRKAALAHVFDKKMQAAGAAGEGADTAASASGRAAVIPPPMQAFFRDAANPNPNPGGVAAAASEETLALLQAAAVQVSTMPGGRDLLQRSPAALAALALRAAPASALSGGRAPSTSATAGAGASGAPAAWLLQASYALAMLADRHIGAGDGGVLVEVGQRLGLDLSSLGASFARRRGEKRRAAVSEREQERKERLAAAGLLSERDDEGRPFGYWEDELGYATGDEPEEGEGEDEGEEEDMGVSARMEDEDEGDDGLMAGIVLPPEVALPGLSARAQEAAREGALFLPQASGSGRSGRRRSGITGPGTEAAFWGLADEGEQEGEEGGSKSLARTGSLVGLLPPEIAQKQAAMAEGRAHSELAFAQRLLVRAIVANAGKALGLEEGEGEQGRQQGWFEAGGEESLRAAASLGSSSPSSSSSISVSPDAQAQAQEQLAAVAQASGVPAATLAAMQAAVRVLAPADGASAATAAALPAAVLAALLRPYLGRGRGGGGEVGRARLQGQGSGALAQHKEAKLPFAPTEAVELAARLGYPARDPTTGSALLPSAKELAAVRAFRKLMSSKHPSVLADVMRRKAELHEALADAPDAQKMVQLLLADVEEEDKKRGEETGEGVLAVLGPGGKPQPVGTGPGTSVLRDPDHPLAGLTVRTSRLPEGYSSWADVAQHSAVNRKRQKAAERALKAQQQQRLDAVIRAPRPQEGRLNPDTPVGSPGGPTARQQRMGHNMAQMLNGLLSDPAWVGPDPSLSGLWPCGLPIEVAEVTLTPNLRTAYVRWQHPVLAKAQGGLFASSASGAAGARGGGGDSGSAPSYASLLGRMASLSSSASSHALKSAGLHPVLKKREGRSAEAVGASGYALASMEHPATATTRRLLQGSMAAAEKRVARYTEAHTKPRRGDRFSAGAVDTSSRAAQVAEASVQGAGPEVQAMVQGMGAALERHAGMLRRALAARMGLRYTPELQFHRYLGPRKGALAGAGAGTETETGEAAEGRAGPPRHTGPAFTGKSKLEQAIRM